jgi:hypothetical protein
MQGNPTVPTVPQTITTPARGPAPAADFQIRKEQQVDKMLEVPAPIVQPVDTTTERLDHISPTAGAGSGAAAGSGTVTAPSAPSTSFEERREQRADKMLEAPQPLVEPSDISTN